MSDQLSFQQDFLERIQEQLDPNISFVDELAEDLSISIDSAYRRIRGETSLTFDEYRKLGFKYNISLDELLGKTYQSVTFNSRVINEKTFGLDPYLTSIISDLELMASQKQKELVYAAKDIPIFYFCIHKEFMAFKFYFWQKLIFNFSQLENKKFSPDLLTPNTEGIGRQVWEKYIRIPSIEVWSYETINSTLRQIEFCHESGLFESKGMAELLCDQLLQIINHQEKQAELGYKIDKNTSIKGEEDSYKLYHNQVLISNNTIVLRINDQFMVLFPHNTVHVLTTSNQEFCSQTDKIISNIIKNSTLISQSGAKHRNQFFQVLRNRTENVKQNL